MRYLNHSSILLLILSVAACGGGSGSAPGATTFTTDSGSTPSLPSSESQTCGLKNFQQVLMNQVNAARANSRMCGSNFYKAVPALTWNDKLFSAAAAHSNDMATKDYFSHTSADGRSFLQRISAAGYSAQAAGENIAAGFTTIESTMDGWLKSEGHCANIMNERFTEFATACAKTTASAYKYYWTMDLALPR